MHPRLPRINRPGVGDDDPTMVEPVALCVRRLGYFSFILAADDGSALRADDARFVGTILGGLHVKPWRAKKDCSPNIPRLIGMVFLGNSNRSRHPAFGAFNVRNPAVTYLHNGNMRAIARQFQRPQTCLIKRTGSFRFSAPILI
jgi:hypothetical protein